jgi:hypothetical protein
MNFKDDKAEKICDEKQSFTGLMNDLSILKQQQSMKTAITKITTTTGGKNIATGNMSLQNACVKEATIPSTTQSSSSSTTTTKRQKTLSFLHNEDLLDLNEAMSSGQSPNLMRSISFQERKFQLQNSHASSSSIKRTESIKSTESGGENTSRKIAIVSPKNLYYEVNENFRKHQAQIQQQIIQQMQSISTAFNNSPENFM